MTDRATKLVILDFDGTIADTQSLITTTMMQTIEALGLESRTREECARMIGLPLKETFTRLIPMSDEMGDMCEATYRRLFDCNNTEGAVTLYPKVRETIDQHFGPCLLAILKEQVLTCLLTSTVLAVAETTGQGCLLRA